MLNLFTKRSVGIDIADHTIEVVEILKDREGVKPWSKGRVLLDRGIVENGRVKNKEKLAEALKKCLQAAKPHPIITRKAVFGLPERQVYIHSFYITEHEESDRESIILKEAQENIPLKKDDLLYAYKSFPLANGKTEVLLVGTSREVATEWFDFFGGLGIEANIFDIESLAVFRGLFPERPKKPVCVIDVGTNTTHIAIFDKNGLWYAYSDNIAGDSFTKEIAKALGKNEKEAEKLKREIGLSQPGERIFFALTKILFPMVEDIRATLDYFKKETGEGVREAVLVGGSSELKGLSDYVETNLGIPVRIGKSALFKSDIPLVYVEASGLALRGVEPKWDETDPAIIFSGEARKDEEGKNSEEKSKQRNTAFLGKKNKTPLWGGDWKPIGRAKKRIIGAVAILLVLLIAGSSVYYYRRQEEKRIEEAARAKAEAVKMLQKIKSERAKREEEKKARIEAEKKAAKETPKITVKKTPTGWLNVRKGPGIGYSKMGKVYPGNDYELLEEKGGWYKIKVNGDTEGWITSRYARKQ